MVAPLPEHKNKWESTLHMDGYNVVGVIAIPYLGSRYIITIVSKEEKMNLMSIESQSICPDCVKMFLMAMGKRGEWVLCKHLYYIFKYMCKVVDAIEKFVHTATFSYN